MSADAPERRGDTDPIEVVIDELARLLARLVRLREHTVAQPLQLDLPLVHEQEPGSFYDDEIPF